MKKGWFFLFRTVVVALLVLVASSLSARQNKPEFVPGQLLIKFKNELSTAQIQSTFAAAGIQQTDYMAEIGVYLCRITKDVEVHAAVEECKKDPNVLYAEPNYIYRTSTPRGTPNDPRFDSLWGMNNSSDADIDAPEAWDKQTGSRDVLVAIIDTGIDYNHEDLRDNIWRNPGESGNGKENNGVDDDSNGFVDDVYGWDFAADDNDPMDDNGHGTHVAGTVGAVGNNGTGVVGVNWQVRMMALKFLDSQGSGTTDNAVKAILYAADNGAIIQSNSWGGGGASQALQDAIAYARDKNSLFIAAAGNNGTDNDISPNYPSNYDVENVVAVAASDNTDRRAEFSNYGKKTVDLFAPGVDILSCQPGNRYQSLSGTSMATPHVSGVAALVAAQYPGLTYRQLMIRVLGSVDRKANYSSTTVTGGRLNADKALSTAPIVALVTRMDDTDDTAGPYVITAEAVDDGSIASMTLSYTINDGAAQTLNMAREAGDRYRAEIPGQSLETTIAYYVEATDDGGATTRSRSHSFKITSRRPICGGLLFTLPSVGGTHWGQGALVLANLLFLLLVVRMFGRRRLAVRIK